MIRTRPRGPSVATPRISLADGGLLDGGRRPHCTRRRPGLAGQSPPRRTMTRAAQLFVKVWEPGKRSPTGGDGLGPLYNETSCVACHRLGGIGGGGGNRQNVTLLRPTARGGSQFERKRQGLHRASSRTCTSGSTTSPAIVLHRHATSPPEQKRLEEIEFLHERRCARSPVHAADIVAEHPGASSARGSSTPSPTRSCSRPSGGAFEGFPEIKGRVSRLPDGRIGRFGWKGQTATLREFVLAACANELGLEVPGHHQPQSRAAGTILSPSAAEARHERRAVRRAGRLRREPAAAAAPSDRRRPRASPGATRSSRRSAARPATAPTRRDERHLQRPAAARHGRQPQRCGHVLRRPALDRRPGGPRRATGTAPGRAACRPWRRSGGRRRSGASPTRHPICTTAGRGRSTRPSGSTAARPRETVRAIRQARPG